MFGEINEIMVRKFFINCSKVWTIVSCCWCYYYHLQRPSNNDVAGLCAKVLQLCLALCDPMDCSLPGSSVHGGSPGKNTRVGCHFFLQGIFLTQRSNPRLFCLLHWQGGSFPLAPPGKHQIWGLLIFLAELMLFFLSDSLALFKNCFRVHTVYILGTLFLISTKVS